MPRPPPVIMTTLFMFRLAIRCSGAVRPTDREFSCKDRLDVAGAPRPGECVLFSTQAEGRVPQTSRTARGGPCPLQLVELLVGEPHWRVVLRRANVRETRL